MTASHHFAQIRNAPTPRTGDPSVAHMFAQVRARRGRSPRTGQQPYMMMTPPGSGGAGCRKPSADCVPPGCSLPSYLAREAPGWPGPNAGCQSAGVYAGNAQAVPLSGTGTIVITALTEFCIDELSVVTTGTAGFLLTSFDVNNTSVFIRGSQPHSSIFAPDANNMVKLNGPCVYPGSDMVLGYLNLDTANPQSIFVTLKGPSRG